MGQITVVFSIIILVNLALLMPISSTEDADKLPSTFQNNETTTNSSDQYYHFDYIDGYSRTTIRPNLCSYATLKDVQTGIRILQENLPLLKAKSPLSTEENNKIHTCREYLEKLQKIELDLKTMCPEYARYIAEELQPEPYENNY